MASLPHSPPPLSPTEDEGEHAGFFRALTRFLSLPQAGKGFCLTRTRLAFARDRKAPF